MISANTLNFCKTMKLAGIVLGCFLIAVPCFAGGSSVGDTVPDFSSLSTSGRFFDLSGIEGKSVLLSFWSDWCSSERQELTFLKRVSDRYPEVVIVIVDSESGIPSIRSLTRIARSLAEWDIDAKILVDRDLEVTGLYNVTALPTSLLIDSSGTIAYRQPNFFNSDTDGVNASLDRAVSVSFLNR
ncbi:TlpA family protein disulfide reductase [bacterium]|nr:TlpA family protein disulfide reductase [bacterium]